MSFYLCLTVLFIYVYSLINIGETAEHGEKLCDDMEAMKELIYVGDGLNSDVGCEVRSYFSLNPQRCEYSVSLGKTLYLYCFNLPI